MPAAHADATAGPSGRFRRWTPRAMASLAAAILSCASPVPTRPLALVHVAGSIAGRDGAPLAEVEVYAYPESPVAGYDPDTRAIGVTDSSGAFSLALVEGTYEVRLTPPRDSGLPYSVTLRGVRIRPAMARLDYRFGGTLLAGTVTAPDGAPLDSGRVIAIRLDGGDGVPGPVRNGAFSLLVSAGVTYGLTVIPGDRYSGVPIYNSALVSVAADTTVALDIPGSPVTGTVTDPGGTPIAGVLVSDGPAGSRTDVTGGYRLWAWPDRYGFLIDPTPVAPQVLQRRLLPISISGPTVLDFSLAGTRWDGTVRWEGTGDPVEGAVVTLSALTYFRDQRIADTTGTDGRYDFVAQPGLEYDLRATVSAPAAGYGAVLRLVAGADSTIDVTIAPALP